MQRLQPLIYELSSPGRTAFSLPELDVPATAVAPLPADYLREQAPALPEVSEVDVIRHFTGLSQLNHGVDTGFYPLGSCTMKYNPKISEDLSRLPGFANLHPLAPEAASQGALQLMYEMQQYLAAIAGMDAVTLQPAAGAHGELTGLMLIRAYHEQRGGGRTKIIVPDSAHGTNPASAAVNGFTIVQVKSDGRGGVDLDALKAVLDDQVACLMLTNPNTLGLFDENIHVIADLVHAAGGLLYYDGANANAIMGYARPGDAGFDVIHFNLHKTFATPHGGGGPGSGPVGCKAALVPFLPVPVVAHCTCGCGCGYYLDYDRPASIGRVKSFYANFGVVVKAYAYIREMGPDGLRHASEDAVLNANYLAALLKEKYHLVYDRICMHEFVLSGDWQKKANGVRTLDIAKRLLDFGFHPPTVYFPLIVDECLMIEPTETESRETLDSFVAALLQIADEAATEPGKVKAAPHDTIVGRLDESRAARQPVLRWRPTVS